MDKIGTVQRASTAKGNEVTCSHVDSALHTDLSNSPRHSGSNDFENAFCAFFGTQSQSFAELLHALIGSVIVKLETSAEQGSAESSQHHVGIRDRELFSTAVIGHGAWFSSCTMRTDAQAATGISPRNRTTACANGVNIHAGKPKRHRVNLTSSSFIRLTTTYQRNVGTGSTNIKADDFIQP